MALLSYFSLRREDEVEESPDEQMDWGRKYAPRTLAENVVNVEAVSELREWLLHGDGGVCVVEGPNGCGKTVLTSLAVTDLGLRPVHMSIGENRNKSFMKTFLDVIDHYEEKTVLVLDNIDASSHEVMGVLHDLHDGTSDGGGASVAKRSKKHRARESSIPIVCISNNTYGTVTSLSRKVRVIRFVPVPDAALRRVGLRQLAAEGSRMPESDLDSFVSKCRGDLRYFTQQLEFFHSTEHASDFVTERMKSETVFDVCEKYLCAGPPCSVGKAMSDMSIDSNVAACMIFENYLECSGVEHVSMDSLASAADAFSRNDLLSSTHSSDLQPYWDVAASLEVHANLQSEDRVVPAAGTPPQKLRYTCVFSKLSLCKSHANISRSLVRSVRQGGNLSIPWTDVTLLAEMILSDVHAGRFDRIPLYDIEPLVIFDLPKLCNIRKTPLKQRQKTMVKKVWTDYTKPR